MEAGGVRAVAALGSATGRVAGGVAPSGDPRRGSSPRAAGLAALLCLVDRAEAADGNAALSLPSIGVLLLLAAVAAGLGYLLGQRRHAGALRAARTGLQLSRQLVDDWQWRTDAQHALVALWPPERAPQHSWDDSALVARRPLWEQFDVAGHGQGLRARLEARASIDELEVLRAGSQGVQRWRLRGRPCFDAGGAFEGYLGSARPLDESLDRRADQHALEALLPLWPGPLWLGDRDPLGGAWRVRRCNAAAARLSPGAALHAPWDAMLAALPVELREAAAALQPSVPAAHGPWLLHLHEQADARPPSRLLALLPRGEAGGTELADSDAAAFSYTVSHDLRAPIRVVEGFARIVKEDYGRLLDRVGNDHLDRVLSAAGRMNSMIDALLSLARLSSQPLARQPVDLSQLAGFVIEDLRRQHPERRVEVRIAPGLQAEGDPTLLRVVLENLLGNAWKYSARNGDAHIAFESVLRDGRPSFVISDDGAGFDMRFADRLFNVFQRLHGATDFPGTGIGLASVRRIVRRHGGEVWAEAEVGRGARFWFTIGTD